MPDPASRLALADANMAAMYRIDACATAGGFVVERDGLVCCGAPGNSPVTNMAIVTGAVAADVIREATASTFKARGLPFTVWTRHHSDGVLEATLARSGFTHLARVPGMVFADGDGAPVAPPRGIQVRAVASDGERAAFAELAGEAWSVYGTPPASTAAHFATLDHLCSPSTAGFLAWEGARAVAGAVLYHAHDVAGIGWVSTRSDARGRGLGSAVTWAAVHEGLRRGAQFASLQASPMGEGVYRRMGFRTLTHYGAWLPPL